MRLIYLIVVLAAGVSASCADAAETWTNRAGKVFSARILSVSDAGAVFCFSEDGATNVLALAKLHPASAEKVCNRFDYAPIPARLAATFNRATADLKRISFQVEDELLNPEDAAIRRATVIRVFGEICREKGLDEKTVRCLSKRLEL